MYIGISFIQNVVRNTFCKLNAMYFPTPWSYHQLFCKWAQQITTPLFVSYWLFKIFLWRFLKWTTTRNDMWRLWFNRRLCFVASHQWYRQNYEHKRNYAVLCQLIICLLCINGLPSISTAAVWFKYFAPGCSRVQLTVIWPLQSWISTCYHDSVYAYNSIFHQWDPYAF